MHATLPRPVSALVLALAAGMGPMTPCFAAGPNPLTSTQIATLSSQLPARTLLATARLLQVRDQLGLGSQAGFTPHQAFTTTEGRTVVRLHQTHQGLRVWAGEAIAHVEPDGQVKTLTQGVKTGVTLASDTPVLNPDQARAIALRSLAARGPMGEAPKVELVVFPTQFTGGLATRFDPKRGAEIFDREMSTWAKAPADAFVLAYEVKTLLANKQDGHKEITFIIDANTGAVLRKRNALQGDSPAQGTGTSFYKGAVSLSTAKATDGSYALKAMDRGTLPQPYVAAQGETQIGMATYYGYVDMVSGMMGFLPYQGHASNAWGNGTLIPPAWDFVNGGILLDYSADDLSGWLQGALTPTGETTAVDAHYGLSTTWDFYQNVFHRNGIDNLGTSTFAIVHTIEPGAFGAEPLFDNAMWAPWYFGMQFGDGSYPAYAGGLKSVTEIDITGHELTHGVTEYSASLIYDGLSGGLNEGTSDMLGKMVQAYSEGGPKGSVIPNFPAGDLTKWEIGHLSGVNGGLRYMYKPSLDGPSSDVWYDGLELLDVHFSSGPPNRFFYFLCEGASANASSVTYSPYLPGGMAGLGNDKAARIWYKTLTEHLASDADFNAARAASITAAGELYGANSAEVSAVMKAWAAVNVGTASGTGEPVRVTFPVVNGPGSFLDTNAYPSGILAKVQLFPVKTNVFVRCNVANTTNTKVTWSMKTGPMDGYMAGTINPDGSWTTPSFPFYEDLLTITATSQADPKQFAKGRLLLIPADADTDNETDALDMGSVAMSWGLPNTPNPAAQMAGYGISDWDLVFLGEALANAFPVK